MKPCLSLPQGRMRPARTETLDDLMRLLHDQAVRRYLCDDVALPRETVAAMLARSARLDEAGLGLWVIETKRGCFAGIAGLQPVSAELDAAPGMAGSIEPVIALAPESWGQGLAGEALDALIGYARTSLGVPRLVAAVDQPNIRSHRLLQRCGFTTMGSMPGPAQELVLYERPIPAAEALR